MPLGRLLVELFWCLLLDEGGGADLEHSEEGGPDFADPGSV